MNLVLLFAALVVAFALLHFFAVPAARRRVNGAAGRASIGAAGIFAFADVLRTIAFLAALATLICLVLLGAAELAGKGNLGQVQFAVQTVVRWRALLEQISPVLSIAIAALCGCGLLLLGRRRARAKVTGMLAAADRAEGEQILEQLRNGTAKEEPDTAAMADIRGKVATLDAQVQSLQQAVDSETNAQTKAALEKQLGERRQLLQLGIATLIGMDIDRRRTPPKPLGNVVPAPTSRWERFQDVLFSRGTLSMMSGASRALFVLVMLLLVPSLLGVASVPTGVDLSSAEIRLSAIQMKLQGDAAQQQWQEASEAAPPAAANAAQISDEQALDDLTSLYNQGVAFHYVNVGGLADHAVSSVRLSQAREHILSSAAAHNASPSNHPPTPTPDHPPSASDHSPLPEHSAPPIAADAAPSPVERAYLDTAQQPLSPEAIKFREDLRHEVMERQPDVWRKLKGRVEGLRRSFTVPLDQGMMRGMLASRVASAGLGGVGDALPPELATLSSGIGESTIEDTYRIRSGKFLASAMSSGNGDSAVHAMDDGWVPPPIEAERDRTMARSLPETSALEQRVAAEPPRFPAMAEPHAAEATRAAESLMATAPRSTEAFSDSLATFDDFFPGSVGAERATARGVLLEARGVRPSIPSGVLYQMAGDFRMLRGFSRIGGVLIGQDPKNADETLDFVDIAWKTTPNGVVLTFTRADGVNIDLGPHPASLIAQSLNYAADGRPVTATMTRATPLADLKVLANPTLVDTGVGCRAIEIDRFVDTFLHYDPRGDDVRHGVDAALDAVQLYNLAQRAFSIGYIQNFPDDDEAKRAKRVLVGELDELEAQVALDKVDANTLLDPQRSPLTIKKEFFEPNVVAGIGPCLATAKGVVNDFEQCMFERGRTVTGDVGGVFAKATDFFPWSGVRERSWSLDPDLNFAKNGPASDPLYPFEFVEQLAALGPANFTAKDDDAYVDPSPFIFPAYRQLVSDIVIKGLGTDAQSRTILNDMRQFTLLERVFRAGLAGKLGPRFPVEKLGTLADVTGGAVKSVHTPRWTPHPGALEKDYLSRMDRLASALAETKQYGDLVDRVDACYAALKDKTIPQLPDISDAQWGANCDLRDAAKKYPELAGTPDTDAQDLAAALVKVSATLREARKLRVALGVPAEEQALRAQPVANGPTCPAL